MANAERTAVSSEKPESLVILVGLVVTIGGLFLPVVTGLGIGLLVAGSTYALTAGSTLQRLALTFVALVAVQLVAFGGVVRLMGAFGLVIVLAGILYGRRRTLYRSLARR